MIGIVGAGTMGKGIAIEFARFNHNVLLISVERHLSKDILYNEVQKIVNKYNFDNSTMILNNIETSNNYDKLYHCDLIIEAVAEDLDCKRELLKKIRKYINNDAIIASNTSSLSIKDVFDDIIPLEKVIGLHFFNPVQVMKLIELSYLEETEKATIDKAKFYSLSIEKEVVIVKNSPGFIVNRLLIPMINEAVRIVEEGIASIEDVDKAMKYGANHPLGPLKLSDLIGNDITLSILNILKESNTNIEVSKLLEENVSMGKLGRKSGLGFYEYKK